MKQQRGFDLTQFLRICALAFLAGALQSAAFAQGTQQGSQAPPSLEQSKSSSASNQSSASPAPSLQGSPGPASSGQAAGNSAAGGAAQAQPQATAAEIQDYQALQKEVDPDKQIQMVKDFVQKYPNSQWLNNVYFIGASAAEQKNDAATSLDFGQKSLKLQPNDLRSLILVAGLLPLPQVLPTNPAQKQQQLTECENDASHALQLLATVQPPPGTPAAQFDQTKKIIEAQLHSALGMAHLEESTIAVTQPDPPELIAAVKEQEDADDLPAALQSYQQGKQYEQQNRLDDAINSFTQAAQSGQGTDIQAYANTVVQQLNVEKSELAMAEQEFKTVAASPQPAAQDFYRLGEVYTRENKLDDAINAFTQAGQHAPGTLIQKYADQMIHQLQAAKAKNPQPQSTNAAPAASGTAPAAPPTPTSKPPQQ
ncbi:MAG TPA: hypothetical protein VKV79_07335 [Terriglobia bacterium]|nr:hypothetical protein [Terriglobia bacterium]